jgi:thiamine-phosphate pyrophosphorylase
MPRGKILGQSIHAKEGEAEAVDGCCDYATLSPIFSPRSKPDDTRARLGLAALGPRLFALGGVDEINARACMRAGAAGVAVLGTLMAAVDPRRVLLRLLAATSG